MHYNFFSYLSISPYGSYEFVDKCSIHNLVLTVKNYKNYSTKNCVVWTIYAFLFIFCMSSLLAHHTYRQQSQGWLQFKLRYICRQSSKFEFRSLTFTLFSVALPIPYSCGASSMPSLQTPTSAPPEPAPGSSSRTNSSTSATFCTNASTFTCISTSINIHQRLCQLEHNRRNLCNL